MAGRKSFDDKANIYASGFRAIFVGLMGPFLMFLIQIVGSLWINPSEMGWASLGGFYFLGFLIAVTLLFSGITAVVLGGTTRSRAKAEGVSTRICSAAILMGCLDIALAGMLFLFY